MSRNMTVLVTGASSGIGMSTAQLLARRGFTVFGTSRNPTALDVGNEIRLVELDVRSDESVSACIKEVAERGGRIDALVNNAGYVVAGAVEEVSIAEARDQFETNLLGPLRVIKSVLPIMRRQGYGTIVNISSLAGLVAAPPFWGIYSASKHALESLSEHLWREVKPFGIRVCLVEPGSIRTGLTSNRLEAAQRIPEYATWRRRAIDASRRLEENGPTPDVVAATVLSALTARAPRLRYRVGREATWIPRLSRITPKSFFDRQLRKTFDIGAMS